MNNTDRLIATINNLLDVAQLEYGGVQFEISPAPLSNIVEEAIQAVRQEASGAQGAHRSFPSRAAADGTCRRQAHRAGAPASFVQRHHRTALLAPVIEVVPPVVVAAKTSTPHTPASDQPATAAAQQPASLGEYARQLRSAAASVVPLDPQSSEPDLGHPISLGDFARQLRTIHVAPLAESPRWRRCHRAPK